MDNETRNTGIMIAVVITAIIVVLLVLFLRPTETKTVERVVDNQLLSGVEGSFGQLNSKINNLESKVNSFVNFENNVDTRITNIENRIQEKDKRIEQLQTGLTTAVVVGIILLVLQTGLVISLSVRKNKGLNPKKDYYKDYTDDDGNTIEDDEEETAGADNESDEPTFEESEPENSHGTFDDMSGKDQKQALNSPFVPKDDDKE